MMNLDELSREKLVEMLEELIRPIIQNKEILTNLNLGKTGTTYTHSISQTETFLRLLWGIGPYLKHEKNKELEKLILETIKRGIDPLSPDYWGKLSDNNQLMVEMPPLCLFFILNPRLWYQFLENEKKQLFDWLYQINEYQMPQNNWLFFRVLVNSFFEYYYQLDFYDQKEKDFTILENFYLGEGWYCDGNPNQTDYYVAFAFHYYSLVYATMFGERDHERADLFKKRAGKFSKDFSYWFTTTGQGLPYGRSLTYRFAQVAFWSACVFADLPDVELGVAKNYIRKNLAYWNKSDMKNQSDLLSVGYQYENLIISEEYNGPGSPYWSLKTFLILAIPEDHPFWSIPEIELTLDSKKEIPQANFLMTRDKENKELQAFTNGQFVPWLVNGAAKYSKFVYSTTFAFNISRGAGTYSEGAFDNTLALSEDDSFYKTKFKAVSSQLNAAQIQTIWKPWSDVKIKSWIIPLFPWHIRIHEIATSRKLVAKDGGFSNITTGKCELKDKEIWIKTDVGITAMKVYSEKAEVELSSVLPNVNLNYNRVRFPFATYQLNPGSHRLVTAFLGAPNDLKELEQIKPPQVTWHEESGAYYISYWDIELNTTKKITIKI